MKFRFDNEYVKEDVEKVMELSNLDYTKAEKYLCEVAKDLDTENVFDVLEVIEQEQAEKGKRTYVRAESGEKKPRKPKTVKISQEKQEIFAIICELCRNFDDFNVLTENKLVEFTKNGKHFTLNLVENRQK